MGKTMRRLGVYGDNLPTKKSKTVVASDFLIAGLIGRFERVYGKAFITKGMNDVQEIFGKDVNSAYYGYEQAEMFFQNAREVDCSLYIKGHVGNTGSAIDAVTASATINDTDTTPAGILKLSAGYKTEPEYGTHGNRIGYTITNGARFTTACSGAPSTENTYVVVDSVAGVRVGDIVDFVHGSSHVYKKVTEVDESAKKIFFADAFGSAAHLDGDAVRVLGIRVRIYEKSITGIVKEVEQETGKIYCTLSPEVTEFYIENVFAEHKYVIADVLTHTSTLEKMFPSDVSTVTYLTGGAYGTTPTTAAHWAYGNESAFDNLPVRILGNCETTLEDVNKSLETYSKGRWDNPKIIGNIVSNQTKSQLEVIGAAYQRSDDVLQVNTAHWLKIKDPFSSSPIAPAREVPNVGAVMGAWIRTIGLKGIHYIPAVKDVPLRGCIGVVGTQFTDDEDRTDLAECGINCIEEVRGYGIVIRNFFTPSISTEFMFANGLLMRDYIKVSAVDSLNGSENMPNSFNRIKEDRMALIVFLRRLWDTGSTGSVPTGETFGIIEYEDGSMSKFEDHIEVKADIVNNPIEAIQRGERNLDTYFTYPAPSGSIKIGVGIMLQS